MNPVLPFAGKRSLIIHLSAMMAMLLLFAAISAAQTGSLADVARQARAQKGQAAPATSQAQQMADELSERENDADAIGGFKTYDTGAYKLWVPAPYSNNGQDRGGTVLSGPRVGTATPLVMIGTPLVVHFGDSDDAFGDASTQFARNYAQSATCTKTTYANHSAYQCGLAGGKLAGRDVGGKAIFLRDSSNIFPVLCVANTDTWARDTLKNPYSTLQAKAHARQVLAQQEEDVKQVSQKCESVFQSIHFISSVAKAGDASSSKPRANLGNPAIVSLSTPSATPAQAQSAQASPVSTVQEKTVPAGFKVQPFNYCASERECWNASVVVPTDAKLVSSDCKQFVFEMKVQESPFLLLAGPTGGEGCGNRSNTDTNQVRWNELADPENRRAPGTFHTISSQQATLDGKPAIITQIGFRKGLTEWMGKRAEIESNGVPLVVGCMAPRDHFADGDSICSGLIESLQLP